MYKKLSDSVEGLSFDHPPENPSSIVGNDTTSYKRPPGSVTPLESVTSAIRGVNTEIVSPPDEDEATLLLADHFQKMRMNLDPAEFRFFGKSSGAMLVHTALELKQEYVGGESYLHGDPTSILPNQRKEFWIARPVSMSCIFCCSAG